MLSVTSMVYVGGKIISHLAQKSNFYMHRIQAVYGIKWLVVYFDQRLVAVHPKHWSK